MFSCPFSSSTNGRTLTATWMLSFGIIINLLFYFNLYSPLNDRGRPNFGRGLDKGYIGFSYFKIFINFFIKLEFLFIKNILKIMNYKYIY